MKLLTFLTPSTLMITSHLTEHVRRHSLGIIVLDRGILTKILKMMESKIYVIVIEMTPKLAHKWIAVYYVHFGTFI